MEIGNDLGIVSAVYLAVLIPWGFLYIHDFISDHWSSLGTTRRNGILHVVVVILPMPVLVFYIYAQIVLGDPDWKEMYAALTALVLSLYHLARTLWGLRQLGRFRAWAVRTAVTLARANYIIRLPTLEDIPTELDIPRRSSASFELTSTARPQSWRMPTSSFLGNIPLVLRRGQQQRRPRQSHQKPFSSGLSIPMPSDPPDISDRHIANTGPKCHTHTFPEITSSAPKPSPLHPQRKKSKLSKHEKLCEFYDVPPDSHVNLAKIIAEVDKMLVNSTVIDNEFIGSSAPRLSLFRLRPFNPVDTFVRWSICFLAQFGRQWLQDCDARSFSHKTWEGRRYSLAADVWATAAVRMDSECSLSSISRASYIPGNELSVSFLSPALWKNLLPHVGDQLFSKQALLEICYRNGTGFPYGEPILTGPIPADPDLRIVAPGMFSSLIKDAQSELPAHLYNIVDGLEPYQLEWFAIYISVAAWSGCTTGPSSPQREGTPPIPTSPKSTRTKNINRRAILAPTHAPVRTLQDQLGFNDDLTLDKCSFPFVAQTYGRELWRNRSILQVSARIDNWLALRIGLQYVSLLKHNPELVSNLPLSDGDSAHRIDRPAGDFDSSDDDTNNDLPTQQLRTGPVLLNDSDWKDRSDKIFHFHRQLEITRLRYQLTKLETRLNDQGQSVSFMGCIMETVRSFLAEYLYEENLADPSYDPWTPQLPVHLGTTIPASAQLSECLEKIAADSPDYSAAFDSTVKERLLWECQNGIVRWLDQKFVLSRANPSAERRPQFLAQSMLLTILAFPSLDIKQWILDDSTPEGCLSFKVAVPAAPQPIYIVVVAKLAESSLYLRLSTEPDGPTRFRWQDWRDAFLGRLDGKAFWQRTHYMRDLQIKRTNAPINSGYSEVGVGEGRSIPVWEGWRPFRARIRKFELEHSSLIIVGDRMPFDKLRTPSASIDMLVNGTAGEGNDEGDRVNAMETIQSAVGLIEYEDSSVASAGGNSHRILVKSSSEAYLQASPSALSDASSHVDSVLRLYSSLFDKTQRQELTETASEDEGASKAYMVFAPLRTSPESSSSSISPEGITPPMGQFELVAQVNNQDPEAMYLLAKCLLNGTRPYRKDRDRALSLLERAVSIGRRLRTARLFVKTLLDRQPVREEDAQRALEAVEKLWRDLPRRRRPTGGVPDEKEVRRMTHLIRLHVRIIHVYKRAEVMRDLGNRIATFGVTPEDEERAILLFESAIIADSDIWAMIGLAFQQVERDFGYARKLYEHAEKIWRLRTLMLHEEILPRNVGSFVEQLAKDGSRPAKLLLGWRV